MESVMEILVDMSGKKINLYELPNPTENKEAAENPPKRVKIDADEEAAVKINANVHGILVDMKGKVTNLCEDEMKNLKTHLKCKSFGVIGLNFNEDLNLIAYFDEERKYNAKVNRHATAFARELLFAHDKLHGNVIFANAETDDDDEPLPLTAEQVVAVTELKPTKCTHGQRANFFGRF